MADSNSVLGFSVVNYGDSSAVPPILPEGAVGTITDSNGATPGLDLDKVYGLNSDVSVNWFPASDGSTGTSRLLIAQYNYGSDATVQVENTNTPSWLLIAGQRTWSGVHNVYGAATNAAQDHLYVIDYDNAALAKITANGTASPVTNGYPLDSVLNFPAFVNTVEGSTVFPPNSTSPAWQNNGVAITVVGSNLYALFTAVDNPWATTPNYADSVVVRLTIGTGGALTYSAGDYKTVGKNAFTLEYYGGKLVVASVGGKQVDGAYNSNSAIHVITTGTGGSLKTADGASVAQVLSASDVDDEFRSVAISNGGDVYLLTGHYSSGYADFSGLVYQTTMTNLISGNPGSDIITISEEEGFLWTLRYYNSTSGTTDRLWFAQGNAVGLYDTYTSGIPQVFLIPADDLSSDTAPIRVHTPRHLNGITLFGAGQPTLVSRGYQSPAFASQSPEALVERKKILEAAAKAKAAKKP